MGAGLGRRNDGASRFSLKGSDGCLIFPICQQCSMEVKWVDSTHVFWRLGFQGFGSLTQCNGLKVRVSLPLLHQFKPVCLSWVLQLYGCKILNHWSVPLQLHAMDRVLCSTKRKPKNVWPKELSVLLVQSEAAVCHKGTPRHAFSWASEWSLYQLWGMGWEKTDLLSHILRAELWGRPNWQHSFPQTLTAQVHTSNSKQLRPTNPLCQN